MKPSGLSPLKSEAGWFGKLLPAGIRARLFLLIILVLLPQGLFLAWIYNERYETRRSEAMKTELEVAEGIAMAFSGYVESIWRQNHSLGEAIGLLSPPVLPKATHLLRVTATKYASVRNLSWVNPQGLIIASSQPELLGQTITERDLFQKLVAGAAWSIGNLKGEGILTKSPTFVIATASRKHNGELAGVVMAGIEPERLGELTLTQQRPDDSAYAIFDARGAVVYHSIYQNLPWHDRSQWLKKDPILQRALETGDEQVGIAVPVLRTSKWISARVPMPVTGWVAGAGTPAATAFAPVQSLLLEEASMSLVVLTLAFLFAYLLARTIALPLQRLEQATSGMEGAEPVTPNDPLAPVEVRRLRQVVIDMAANLRAGEKRFRQALENIPDPVFIVDRQLRIQYVNPATMHIAGLSSEKMLGLQDSEIWPDLYKLWRPKLEATLETGALQTLELELPDLGGMRSFSVTYVPLLDEVGLVKEVMGISHEFTVRKQAEDDLKQTMEELIRSNNDLEQFAYVASHDLQEPLRMVASYVQLLAKRYRGRLDEKAETYMDFAVDGAKRMQELIEDLLSYGRISHGAEFKLIDTNAVLADAMATIGDEIMASGGAIETEKLPLVWGDRMQLLMLFKNLLGNAIKYHKKDLPPQVQVSVRQEGEEWVFSVKDNGIGVEPEYFERIFQIFQRLHTRDQYPGTGIGLAACKKIVERHHGRIWIESEPGAGSTIFFTIPVNRQQAN